MDAALADFSGARDLLEPLVRDFPDVASHRHQLALAHNRIGVVRNETGDPAAALDSYRAARGIMEALVDEHPGEIKYRGFLGNLINNIGLNRENLGDSNGAIGEYRRAAEVFGALAHDQPAEPHWGNLLAAAYHDAGIILGALEGPDSGLRELRKALAIHLEVTRHHPSVSQFRDDLARTYINIGDLQRKAGDRAAALKSMQQSLAIRQELLGANPGMYWNQNQVAASHLNIGTVQFESGDFEGAEQSYRQALAIASPLAAAHADKPMLVATLGRIDFRLGQVQLAARRSAEAVATLDEAIQHHSAAVAHSPRIEEYRRLLAQDYFVLAGAQCTLGRAAQATAAERAGLDLAPNDPEWLLETAGEVARCGPQSAGEAIVILRRAIAAGSRDASRFTSDPALSRLRSRDDFGLMMMDLAFPSDPFARGE
jgi:tetratricopeptide (TPR) repeat protein